LDFASFFIAERIDGGKPLAVTSPEDILDGIEGKRGGNVDEDDPRWCSKPIGTLGLPWILLLAFFSSSVA
jgi:hypothetical protein